MSYESDYDISDRELKLGNAHGKATERRAGVKSRPIRRSRRRILKSTLIPVNTYSLFPLFRYSSLENSACIRTRESPSPKRANSPIRLSLTEDDKSAI